MEGDLSKEDSPEYAAALNDLAQLKLDEGEAEEAQELFRQALGVQERLAAADNATAGPAGEEEGAGSGSDDWETRWDAGGLTDADLLPQPKQQPARSEGWGGGSSGAGRPGGGRRGSGAAAPSSSAAPPTRQAAAAADGADAAPAAPAEVPFGGAHILEMHDLASTVKTSDLEKFLARLAPSTEVPPVVKWVDDYRALALFANPRAAQAALQAAGAQQGSAYPVRGWCDASALSRATPAGELQAPKPRPLTTATVARRLIGGALNMRLRDREEEQVLAAARRELKTAQVQRREKLDEAWGDD